MKFIFLGGVAVSDSIVLHLKTWNVKGAPLTSLKTDVVNLI